MTLGATSLRMSVRIRIPSALRAYADGESTLDVPATSVDEALRLLVARHERLRAHLYDEAGELRSFVGLYLNQRDVRAQRASTPTQAGDVLVLLPSVAGGAA